MSDFEVRIDNATAVLVVEKDAVFQDIIDSKFAQEHEVIVLTGRGHPDFATRILLRRLYLETLRTNTHIPFSYLGDWDPHGISIYLTYLFGGSSLSTSASPHATPVLEWIGLNWKDIELLPENVRLSQTDTDRRCLQGLLKLARQNSVKSVWMTECELLEEKGFKCEIEALTSLSSFNLTEVYLPNVLLNKLRVQQIASVQPLL
eukprot:Lankesteria_metandrocarpae@DN2341_c0_g1_i1.p1